MYSSNYTHVPRYTLSAQKKKQMQRSKGKSCGYYMRIIFFFTSLIQSLIIVSLVLFQLYWNKPACCGRVADLEQTFNRNNLNIIALKDQRTNLTKALNTTAMERLRMEQDLFRMRNVSYISYQIINELNAKLMQCTADKNRQIFTGGLLYPGTRQIPKPADCETKLDHHKAKEQYLQSQLNQTVLENTIKTDKLNKERDDLSLEAIDLRNDKQMLQSEIANFKLRCKQDFVASLSGISNVSRAFLEKIDSLFPNHIPFQLTCEKQRENLEQIRSNCTSLSRDVEDKFQRYLDSLGSQVSTSLGRITRLEAENQRLSKDLRSCNLNRTGMVQEHRQHLQRAQLRCDETTKKLLTEKKTLSGNRDLLESKMRVKEMEIAHLKEQNRLLNSSCSPRNPLAGTVRFSPGGSSPSAWNPSRYPGSPYNVNTLSSVSAGSTGLNKPATNGINGASNVGLTGTDAGKKPAVTSNGLGNTRGQGGTASQGSSWSSAGTSLGSSSTGLGKPSIETRRYGPTSTGLGGGLGNTGLGNPELGTSGLARGTGSVGSVGGLGGGRTGGTGPVYVSQHLQELQRYSKPSSTEKKNESPRTFG